MARGRTSKATKKFETKHLSRTIENRKIQKRNKDKYNKNKVPPKAAANAVVEGSAPKKAVATGKGTLFDGMSMDEFLETGGGGGGREDVAMKDVRDDEDMHEMEKSYKVGLEGLQEKDPSFYEFLKQNDRELLEFDPDELVEEEEDEDDGEEAGPVEGGLTVGILSKWEKMLIEEKSLGTLKKVLIAVKNAAANVTGEESQGNVKYVLTDPEGIQFNSTIMLIYHSFRSIIIDCLSTNSRGSTTPCPRRRKERKISSPIPKLQTLTNRPSSQITFSLNITSPSESLVSSNDASRSLTNGEIGAIHHWIP